MINYIMNPTFEMKPPDYAPPPLESPEELLHKISQEKNPDDLEYFFKLEKKYNELKKQREESQNLKVEINDDEIVNSEEVEGEIKKSVKRFISNENIVINSEKKKSLETNKKLHNDTISENPNSLKKSKSCSYYSMKLF